MELPLWVAAWGPARECKQPTTVCCSRRRGLAGLSRCLTKASFQLPSWHQDWPLT